MCLRQCGCVCGCVFVRAVVCVMVAILFMVMAMVTGMDDGAMVVIVVLMVMAMVMARLMCASAPVSATRGPHRGPRHSNPSRREACGPLCLRRRVSPHQEIAPASSRYCNRNTQSYSRNASTIILASSAATLKPAIATLFAQTVNIRIAPAMAIATARAGNRNEHRQTAPHATGPEACVKLRLRALFLKCA